MRHHRRKQPCGRGKRPNVRVGVVTVSDGVFTGRRDDESGRAIVEIVSARGDVVVDRRVVPDEVDAIRDALLHMVDELDAELVLTTGGTGVAPRDVTPEATKGLLDKEVPGIAEAMRYFSLAKTPRAMLSRAVAGIRKRTLIVNLPGSARAVRECLGAIYPELGHAVALIRGLPSGH